MRHIKIGVEIEVAGFVSLISMDAWGHYSSAHHACEVFLPVPAVAACYNPVVVVGVYLRGEMRNVHGPAVIDVYHLGGLMLLFVHTFLLLGLSPLTVKVHDSFQSFLAQIVLLRIMHIFQMMTKRPIGFSLVLPRAAIKVGVVHGSDVFGDLFQSQVDDLLIVLQIQIEVIDL
jgi:hypothetical protein